MKKRIFNIESLSEKEYEKYFLMMKPEKQAKINRFRFEEDKKRSVSGEMLARKMISEETGEPEESIIFSLRENKKPYAQGLDINFNISHSGKYVICAVSGEEIGADIEKERPVSDALIKRVCNEKEKEYVCQTGTDEKEKIRRFFEIWTFKEAYFKYLGTGIEDFQKIDYFNCGKKKENGETDGYAYCIIY